MLGISTVGYDSSGIDRCSSFCNWLRMVIPWKTVQPTLDQWDWSSIDREISHARTNGYSIILDVGDGFTVPSWNNKEFLPNIVGTSKYLKYLQQFTSEVVNRYKDRVSIFQIEREVNQAFLTGLWGWRDFNLGGAWKDWGFITEIITSLSSIVHEAGCKTTTQIHTDVHPKLNLSIKTPTWLNAAEQWSPYLDFIGISAYPNYIRATPIVSIKDKIESIQKITKKLIIVLETGYPVTFASQSLLRSHNIENQKRFLEQNITDCMKLGVYGYFWFPPHAGNGFNYKYTSTDLYAMEKLALCMEIGDIQYFYQLLLSPGLSYVRETFPKVLQSTESGFQMFNSQWNELPATTRLQEIYSTMKSFTWNPRRGNNLLAFPIKPILSLAELFRQMNATIMIYMDSEGNFKNYTDKDGPFEVKQGIGYLIVIREAKQFTYWGTDWGSQA